MKYLLLVALAVMSLACTVSMSAIQTPAAPPPVMSSELILPAVSVAPSPIRSAVVMAETLNIRRAATWHSSTLGIYLYRGDSVIVTSCHDGWAQVQQGYVNAAFLSGRICR